ncbi:hypothetical protein GCM10009799_28280 [Nocardiopsis rhodophaea]|uniref:Uncharacterized protein n=1 Tax=Nocardiopsis rhodophaea TaxID=280238 RepID=A0ABN2T5Q4_9ACTN
MDIQELAARVRAASYGPASAEAVDRQVGVIAKRLDVLAADFGYDPGALSIGQAAVLEEVYLTERNVPAVEADDIRELYEAHEPGAVPQNEDMHVIAVDPTLWQEYALMSAGEARALGFHVVFDAARLARRLGDAELTDDLADTIAWELTSEASPG